MLFRSILYLEELWIVILVGKLGFVGMVMLFELEVG